MDQRPLLAGINYDGITGILLQFDNWMGEMSSQWSKLIFLYFRNILSIENMYVEEYIYRSIYIDN